ncbi:MAG: NHL repeat-containing protein [Phycisphaerales bacterium]
MTRIRSLVAPLCLVAAASIAMADERATPSAPPVASPANRPSTQRETPFRFGSFMRTLGPAGEGGAGALVSPMDAAVTRDNTILVVDRDNHRIVLFRADDPSGRAIGSFGRFGGGEGEFRFPEAIAIGRDGLVFVADTGNHRVQVFDSKGGFVRQWGTRGSKRGQFNRPVDIAVDSVWVYVADSGNDRVQVFERDGRFVTILGGPATGAGDLRRPSGVAVDEGNTVVIADTDNNRIVVFDKAGRFLRQWGDFGPFAGLLDQPSGLATRGGEIFVCDTRNHRIEIFDVMGALLREWGAHARVPHEGEGRLHYPRHLAIAPDGAFAVVCEPFEDRCQVFAALRPGETEAVRVPAPPDEQTHFGKRLGIGGDLLVIPEPERHDAYVFDLRGETPILITRFGERGSRFGQFQRMTGATVDATTKRVRIADEALGRISTFQLDWDPAAAPRYVPLMSRFVKSLATSIEPAPFARAEWPMQPDGMQRDARGRTHVVDPRNRMVFVYDAEMSPLMSYGGAAAGAGELLEPTDAAVGAAGDVFFVADAGRRQVVMFDPRGQPIGAFPGSSASFALARPFGIAAGRDGYVYVTDEASNRVLKFTEDGKFVIAWGTKGSRDGEFWKPAGIEQRADGRLIVLDPGNHRAQTFGPDGTWLGTFGSGKASTPAKPFAADPKPAVKED